jgi:hypothetical protein
LKVLVEEPRRGEAKSIGSDGQEEYCGACGCGGGGEVEDESVGLGLPKIADKMEYSRFAASEPNEKLGSKEVVRRDSFCWGKGSTAMRLSGGRSRRIGNIPIVIDVGSAEVPPLGGFSDLLRFSCSEKHVMQM